jgi:hypothetical protein
VAADGSSRVLDILFLWISPGANAIKLFLRRHLFSAVVSYYSVFYCQSLPPQSNICRLESNTSKVPYETTILAANITNVEVTGPAFVPGKPFQPSLMFAGKAYPVGAYPSEAPFRCSIVG